MGRTVPSFRIALEGEIASWRQFRNELQSKKSRELLESLFNQARSYASFSSMAVRPVVFEGMFIGMVASHNVKLEGMVKEIARLRKEMDENPVGPPEVEGGARWLGEASPDG
jgi:hypothetical protein